MEKKPWDVQLLRSASRAAPSSLAIDTLHRALSTIQKNPNEPKYRRIDLSSPGFKRALSSTPGTLDFLTHGVGFSPSPSSKNIYTLSFVDAARMFAALSALEEIRLRSYEYNLDRSRRVFLKTLLALRSSTGDAAKDAAEEARRAELLRLVPLDPATMSATLITVSLGGGGDAEKLSRKFAADDTLGDVLNWLGGHLGGEAMGKVAGGEFVLLNRSKHPKDVVQAHDEKRVGELKGKTLQYLDLWPSAELELASAEVHGMVLGEKKWRAEHEAP
ncbi:hypothetical protein TeGR_g2155 [Tetraparma gracilis]|uniref:PUB domain-containing protein n=1 Tax=Tetraparma gracilis TaxID=2962635 RepID=A0ABQ6M8Y0_9STRA|nr:hypothetical protein TeGR_g2155 [Tetraparma gracilis]